MEEVKSLLASAIEYLGDAAHKRFVASIVALALTHAIGHAVAGEDVANSLDLIVGGLAGAWSRNTPKVEPVAPAEVG